MFYFIFNYIVLIIMTYQEQLEIEKLNKEIINNIINTVPKEDFIDFYINHTRSETCEKFNLRNTKQLVKVLKLFNYDFSTKKPSKFKGKKSPRSHASYINGGKKSAETQKANWKSKTDNEKAVWSEKQKIAHETESFKTKIKAANEAYRATLTTEQKELLKNKKSVSNKATWLSNKEEILEKAYNTKSKNKSWNSSTPEDKFYEYLVEKFSKNDIIRQYSTDKRYPFNCDFYIKSLDLFIELNFSWTHGGHRFDISSQEDLKKLKEWQEKALTSDYYKNAIETWVVRDQKKYKAAKENNLNYLVFYNESEINI